MNKPRLYKTVTMNNLESKNFSFLKDIVEYTGIYPSKFAKPLKDNPFQTLFLYSKKLNTQVWIKDMTNDTKLKVYNSSYKDKVYDSIEDASEETGIPIKIISDCLSSGDEWNGYTFDLVDEEV